MSCKTEKLIGIRKKKSQFFICENSRYYESFKLQYKSLGFKCLLTIF